MAVHRKQRGCCFLMEAERLMSVFGPYAKEKKKVRGFGFAPF